MDAADVDDAAFGLFQFRQQCLAEQKGGEQVDVQGGLPVLAGKAIGAAKDLDGGVVDEDVELTAERTVECGIDLAGVGFVLDVAGQVSGDVGRAGQVGGLFGDVGGDDVVAGVMKCFNQRTANTAGGASDESPASSPTLPRSAQRSLTSPRTRVRRP